MKQMTNGERDFWRGVIPACIIWTVYSTVRPAFDSYLAVEHGLGVVPYGQLWTWLNPFWWTQSQYAIVLFSFWAAVTAVEYLLATGKNRWGVKLFDVRLVYLQILTTTIFYSLHAPQDVTVTMFWPFAATYPLVSLLLIFQKIPLWFPWNQANWDCAFNGTGNGLDGNPCLSNVTHLGLLHVYSVSYIIVGFCLIFPLIVYLKSRRRA